MRGVYFHDGFAAEPSRHAPLNWHYPEWERQMRWMRACGVNAVEFATMLEFNRIPSTDFERKKIADRLKLLELVHKLGMQFGYLLTNTVVSTVPDGEAPGAQLGNRAKTLCPREPGNFEKTLDIARFYMKTYREADFFEQFAADWGGCECGKCGVGDYLRYVRAQAEIAAELNPKAKLFADTWCIAFWRKNPMEGGWRAVFDHEIEGTREVIAALGSLPKNVHIAMPCHHLYRPLAFKEYGGKAKTPVFPTKADLAKVRSLGRDTLAWTHFVMDDDAYRPPAWGIVHCEVRYIADLLRKLKAAEVNRVVGNLYLPMLQLGNTFAFGKLSREPDMEVGKIVSDFASLMAHPADRAALDDVLRWMENHSYWQEQMPEDGKLPPMECSLSKEEAIRAADAIRPNPKPDLPLPYPAADWLADLRRSLGRMTWAA